MLINFQRYRFLLVLVLVALGGCSASPPYVHRPDEFNRRATGFGKPPTDIAAVTICYAKRGTTPKEIVAMAKAECRRVGKSVRYQKRQLFECPLATPASVVFDCVK